MSIKIKIKNGKIYLTYHPMGGVQWIDEIFEKEEEDFVLKRTFHLSKSDSTPRNKFAISNSIEFLIGVLEGEYFKIYKRILATNDDVLIHESVTIKIKLFIANSNKSIFQRFEKLANRQIIIGGSLEGAIEEKIFNDIVDSFPTATEQAHYINSRITNVMSQYLESVTDAGRAFEKYLNNRVKIPGINTLSSIYNYEYEKYSFILQTLKKMLDSSDSYSEKDWQDKILEIILILYPKYIKCFSEVTIKDFYSNPRKPTNRFLDLMLIDANGTVDVIEIKKPFENCVVTKRTYRDNYTPMKELSGTIMQVEKYLFHLNKWGAQGEKTLNDKYRAELPHDMTIKITNPKGIVILGRNNNLGPEQQFDFEIIRRKYANMMDIITYDDLISRLENILEKFRDRLQ